MLSYHFEYIILLNSSFTDIVVFFIVFLVSASRIHLWFNASSIVIRYFGFILNIFDRMSWHSGDMLTESLVKIRLRYSSFGFCMMFFVSYGASPVSISKINTPTLQISILLSYLDPTATSGDTYSKVPQKVSRSSDPITDQPKSVILQTPLTKIMF